MGPRLRVDQNTFIQKATESKNTVIKTKKVAFQGHTYIVKSGDYYYYTISKDTLNFTANDIEHIDQALL